jgi:hypothetical protein
MLCLVQSEFYFVWREGIIPQRKGKYNPVNSAIPDAHGSRRSVHFV